MAVGAKPLAREGADAVSEEGSIEEARDRIRALERELVRQKGLVEASHSLHSTLDQDELLKIILATAQAAIDCERGTVYLLSTDGKEIWSRVVAGTEKLMIRLPLGRGIAGSVAETGETIRIDDAYADPRFDPSTDKRSGFRTRSILCAPIKNRTGMVVGVFQLLNHRDSPFGEADLEYLDALSVHAALAIENARLHASSLEKERQDREILAAQGIQRALLPEKNDLEVGRFAIAGCNELCEDASGDYYDFIEGAEGRTWIAVGDVSGHGLGSALVMAEARAFLRSFAKTVPDLGVAMTMLNDFLVKDMTGGKFMSLFVGVLDGATGRLEWSSGGHNPPFHWRAATGDFAQLDSTGPVLGVIPGIPIVQGEGIDLRPWDVFVAYTDGVTESMTATGDQFGEERLQQVIRRSADRDPAAIAQAIRDAIHAFTGGLKNRDDVTILVVKGGA